jgi:subtilisin family serine protease
MPRKYFPVLLLFSMFNTLYAGPFLDDELANALKDSSADKELKVIVRLRDSPGFSITKAQKHSRSLLIRELKSNSLHSRENLEPLFKSNLTKKLSHLWLINGFSLTADAGTIKKLAQHPSVRSLTFDRTFSVPETVYSGDSSPAWNISQINAHILWSFGFNGSGIVVAVMDTGADPCNPHLQASYRGGSNSWFDPCGIHPTPYDGIGHGTQVLGIVLGSNDIDTTIGIAASAKWIAAKIFDDAGEASLGGTHLAFQWLLDPDNDPNTDDAPHVVNCSWGSGENPNECITEFEEDIQVLRQAGIAVVFAAGNEGPNPYTSISPANYPDSLSVGAVDDEFLIASFSSRGPSACDGAIYPKLVAPGASIETCDLSFGGIFDEHVLVDGTSFSAPHVSAAFALLMQAFPEANNIDIEQALIASAVDVGEIGPDNVYGNGQIDLYAAYQMLALDYCLADLDHNHLVDLADLRIFAGDWLNPGCSAQSPCRSDFNSDQDVNLLDFSVFASQYMFDAYSCVAR